MLALNAPVRAARREGGRFLVEVGDAAGTRLACRALVNAAALGAWDVARGIEGLDTALIPPRHLAKGSYFSVPGRAPFKALIYPMPRVGSLGIHSVPDLGGGVRFGPDMEWVEEVDYSVDPAKAGLFADAIRAYWPDLPEGALQPDMAGIRPRIWGPGQDKREFEMQTPREHGIKGLGQLFGFESPGLTACLAIAREVGAQLFEEDT
jgi:L-2-hydroxyglutarate oxidase LhgO